ncbi:MULTISPECIES: hypothetical protein [Calothrix]|uniref:Sigma-70 family RNA polymerase sigma factor n=2 Tax=Calothrix TaxID=1186 RepID=A0ABR8A7U6_9CYAN|nr:MULTISPECIES: hypothetical protein [Calothrix]MBD2196071.1 hypothetical protein [Calothrix parietina FACHB-288]MBD2224721.1 hypothetical protein [Calothrix anomala FACHB-343]
MSNDLKESPLIGLLEAALNNSMARSRLLQQQKTLQEIMNDIPARQWLFAQLSQAENPERVKDFIIAMMKSSRLIWNGARISPDVYSEALSRTWVWFMENLGQYQPTTASFVTWFNQKLRWIIHDVIRQKADEERRRLNAVTDAENHQWMEPPAPDPDRWDETIQEWLDLLQNHPQAFKNCRMQSYPQVNCQILLIHILKVLQDSGNFSWNAIAQEYAIEPSALRRFCRTRCFSHLKQLLD